MERKLKTVLTILAVTIIAILAVFVASMPANPNGNVAGIKVRGEIVSYVSPEYSNEEGHLLKDVTSSEEISAFIERAEKDPGIKAVFIEIDSYGGEAFASQEAMEAIKYCSKPKIAVVKRAATSGAYWIATGADTIVASEISEVGGIGVKNSYLEQARQNENNGLTFIELSSGKFKEIGSPNKPLSEEERSLLMRDIMIIHEAFVKDVSLNRNIPIERVREIADGSTMLGEMALENHLIDVLSRNADPTEELSRAIEEEPRIEWYN